MFCMLFRKKQRKLVNQILIFPSGFINKYWRTEIMIKSQSFESVWDALEVNPIKAENMKLRSFLMMAIVNYINETGLTQAEVAKRLHITQPRVSALTQG